MTAPPLRIIVAMTAERVIGRHGRLPWHLPDDLRLFRERTWGGAVIMGRRTYDSLPAPLPGRANLVVSSTLPAAPGICSVPTLKAALTEAERQQRPPFVIGGARLFREALPLAGELLVSWIHGHHPGDVHFPPVYAADWEPVERLAFAGFCHVRYRRRKSPGSSQEEPGPELQPPA